MNNKRYKKNRRDFISTLIKSTTLFCIPNESIIHFTGNYVPSLAQDKEDDFTRFVRSYNNNTTADNMGIYEAQVQLNGLSKLIIEANKPEFKSKTNTERIAYLKDKEYFTTNNNLSIEEAKSFLETIKPARDVITAAIGTSYVIYDSAILLGYALDSSAIALATPPIISIPLLIGSVAMTAWSVHDLFGNEGQNKQKIKSNILSTAEYAGKYVLNQPNQTDTQSLEKNLPGLRFDFTGGKPANNQTISVNQTSLAEKKLIELINTEVKKIKTLIDAETFNQFAEKYAKAMGDVQEEILEKYIKAQNENNQKQIQEQRDKAAFYQSVNNFIGNFANQTLGPQEAKIMNALISSGFLYVAMGPYGWAAVAINIANILIFNKGGQTFEKAMFKMLAQIQKQLNIIIEKVDIIYQTQLEVLKQLQNIIDEIITTRNILSNKLDVLGNQIDRIYRTQLAIEAQNTIGKYEKINRELEDELIKLSQPTSNDLIYSYLKELVSIAIDKLSMKPFTRFDMVDMNISYLKDEIFFTPTKYKYNISLYDTIGLVATLKQYNPSSDIGKSVDKVVHPKEFYAVTRSIIGWLTLSKISQERKNSVVQNLLDTADKSRKILNECASITTVVNKLNLHEKHLNILISDIHKTLSSYINSEYNLAQNTRNTVQFSTIPDLNLETYIDSSREDSNLYSKFANNRNDISLLNIITDLGLCSIKTESKKILPLKNTNMLVSKGYLLGYKNNEISFENVTLNYDKNLTVSFKVKYTGNIHVDKYENWSGQGVGGYVVKTTYSNFIFDKNWSTDLSQKVSQKYGLTIQNAVEGFKNMDEREFFSYLITQHLRQVRSSFIDRITNHIKGKYNIDKTGLPVLVLSSLNNHITSPKIGKYEISYYNELLLSEDLMSVLTFLKRTNFENEGGELYRDIVKSYSFSEKLESVDNSQSIFHISDDSGNFNIKVNPYNFPGFVAIILRLELLNTTNRTMSIISDIQEKDGEHYLCQAINDLNSIQRLGS